MKRLILFFSVLSLSFLASAQNSARMVSGVNLQTGSSYPFVALDATRLVVFSSGSGVAASLPSGLTPNFGAGAVFAAQNIGAGAVTITCSGCLIYSINSTGSATLVLNSGQGVDLWGSNGANYYAVTCSGSCGGVSTGNGYGLDATTFAGADPCLQTQASIYSLGTNTGGIINATKFSAASFATCAVNPFQAPSQSSPINFSGLPTSGLLLLPDVAMAGDLPFYVPNKWKVQGIGGYGPAPSRTTYQPSNTFLANRTQVSASGGASGCSATGTQTVTITGTTLPAAANLLGEFLLCASNASSTAIPTPKNAEIGGMITAVNGNILTLSGAGASGTVTNTGWIISPVIAGWGPTQTFGSPVDQLLVSCQSPSLSYVTGCIGWLDVSGNESTILSNFTVVGADYMGIGCFSSQCQNGGPYGPITVNSAAHGNNSTIAIELGGTGWNAGGGGGSGLCSTSNPCVGIANRGFFGVTMIGSGTGAGDGGIGFDINAQNVRIRDSHAESMKVGALIGDSSVARAVEIDNLTGCTNAGCALTSVVDISASYSSGSVPAPTQNITLKNILPGFANTWTIRDFINLTGVTDPTLGEYMLGGAGNGSTPPMVFTTSQLLSCITTLGVLDTNGSHCAASTQIPIISKLAGTYYAHGFNNNGSTDVCQQVNNAMVWAFSQGITNSVIIDATGFNRPSAFACATSPWSSGGGTYPSSGMLKMGMAAWSTSGQMAVPAGWILQGVGGNGLGSGGATGSLIAPNVNGATSNANFANDTVAGTIVTTLGSTAVVSSVASFSSAMVGHYLLGCATLPCTNQASMVGGIISTFTDNQHVLLDNPAQATLAAAAYTVTPPLIQNSGIIRDVGIEGQSFGTGGANGNGGFVGIYQNPISESYLDNVSFAHINSVAVAVPAAGAGTLSRINVAYSGLGTTVANCIDAPSGVNLRDFVCNTGMTALGLSYGINAAGQSFSITNGLLQGFNIGLELQVSSLTPTNNVTVTNLQSGANATAVNTLVDLGGVSVGGNGPLFAVNLLGLLCPTGCTNNVNDHLQSLVLTDGMVGWYHLGKQISGCRNFSADSHTIGNISNSCGTASYGAAVAFASLAACAAGNKFTIAAITDSTTITWGATITGGGANPVIGMCDGTNWTVVGK